VVLGAGVTALVALAWYLLPFWREQPELSHGYFALPCALALFWQSRREASLLRASPNLPVSAIEWTLCALGILVGSVAALAALAQGPLHSQTAFLTGLTASIYVVSAVIWLARQPAPWVHLNGATLAAAALWWFVVPLPSGTLSRFTLFLQDTITSGSLLALHTLGFPALRHGNVIQLANTLVGVEEACSGIRSLTACLFAGVVLGGFMLRGIRRRLALVLTAGAIAIIANFIRSTSLCLMAARGVEINGFWHDTTAYAVLGLTALILFGTCLLFTPKREDASAGPAKNAITGRGMLAGHFTLGATLALLVVLVAVKVAPTSADDRPPPDLQALLVMAAPGWQRHSDESIFNFSQALNTSYLRQETYLRGDTQLTFYVAFWPTDQSTLGSVALHTPEICLPGSGWITRPMPPAASNYPLPSPRRFSFEKEGYPQHVWFWHYFNGRPVSPPAGLYPWQLGPALLKRGIRARAPQWVIRISSNQPLESLQQEPIMQEFVRRLAAAGLAGRAAD
jgi:exosortase